jgi:hypothetical protein
VGWTCMPNKKSAARSSQSTASKKRQVKQPTYKSFRVSKRIRQPKAPLIGSVRLFIAAVRLLIKKWRLFGGIVLVYLVLTVVLVKGFGVTSNIGQLKSTLLELFHGGNAQLVASLTLFSVLLGNANSTASDVAGAYQSMLLIIISLVLIWALRQSLAGKKAAVAVREAFYKGLYQLVPFVLVLLVIGLQLIPFLIANFLYSVVFGSGLAVTALEQSLWGVLLGLLVLLTLYMVTSSVFALYIVTLPNVRPMQALRSARDLVRHRRWMIMRKVIFLPLALFILAAVIVIPIIIVSPGVAEWVFFILSMLGLAIVHSYFYHLYRELL